MKKSIKDLIQNSVSPKSIYEKSYEKSTQALSYSQSPTKNSLLEKKTNNSKEKNNIPKQINPKQNIYIEEIQDNYEEEINPLDYRIEIEKRFKNSVANKIFSFPRKLSDNNSNFSDSDTSSLDSLKKATFYDLQSQNYKCYYDERDEKHINYNHKDEPKNIKTKGNESSEKKKIPHELTLGVNYKNFLNLLEKTIKNVNIAELKKIKVNNFFKKEQIQNQNLSPNSTNTPHFVSCTNKNSKENKNFIRNVSKDDCNKIKKERISLRSQIYNHRNNFSHNAIQNNTSNSFGKNTNQTMDQKTHLTKQAQDFIKKKTLLDKNLIKNIKLYRQNEKNVFNFLQPMKTNEKSGLYENIKTKLLTKNLETNNISLNKNHKKYVSCYNDCLNVKPEIATTKRINTNNYEFNNGTLSEEIRHPGKHKKKLTDLIKSYDYDESQLKQAAKQFRTSRNSSSNEKLRNLDPKLQLKLKNFICESQYQKGKIFK